MLIAALGCLWCGADASVLTSGGRTHFDRASELYALGRWADARQEFAAVCGAVPQTESSLCAEADYYMAMCAMELKEAGAEARLAEFLRQNPESVHVNDVEFALASLLCTAGRYDEAQRAFGKVDYATLSPEHRQQYDIRMGYVEFGDGNYAISAASPRRANIRIMRSTTSPISPMSGATTLRPKPDLRS